jgi:hypothetical protein
MPDRKSIVAWVQRIASQIPCKNYEELDRYIAALPQGKITYPKPELELGDHWFCMRKYIDAVTNDSILEVYIGSKESGTEYMGYDRIDPRWTDAEGRDEHRWELTRAYMRPRYRGHYYSIFMIEMVMALARKNKAYSVVAYPRHVAMLVTLLNYGFKTLDGSYDETLQRILKQGKAWYGKNPAQRQLYYAQEFRPFIQDGSFIMERKVAGFSLMGYLLEKV